MESSNEKEAKAKESKGKETKEKRSKEKGTKEKAKERVAEEKEAKEKVTKEKDVKEKEAKEKEAKEKEASEKEIKDIEAFRASFKEQVAARVSLRGKSSSVAPFKEKEAKENEAKDEGKVKKPKKTFFRYSNETIEAFDPGFNVDVATQCESLFRGTEVFYKKDLTDSFSHIVDLDSFEYHKIVFYNFLSEILQSAFFRFGILFLVLLNAFFIGLQTNDYFANKRGFVIMFQVVDQVILGVFIFEILLKWIYDFKLFWKVWWNILDSFIVGIVVVTAIVPQFSDSKFLVTVRVVRAFRSLRSVSSLTSLTIVAHTVVKSIVDMGNILFVLMLFMIVMSVMGVTLFDLEEIKTERFLHALEAWYVVFICVTQDGWHEVLKDMRRATESAPLYYIPLALYLIICVSIGAFVFANLIVAVIVANLEMAVRELQAEKQLSENPLELGGQFSVHRLNVTSIYDEFALNNDPLRIQRPLRLPWLGNISPRKLHAYIMLVVALEQNMLEADVIRSDLERIMSIQLCLMHQLKKLTPENKKQNKSRGSHFLRDYRQSLGAINLKGGTVERMEIIEKLKNISKGSQNSKKK